MNGAADIQIRHGFAQHEREAVAQLYWGAFGGKFSRIMGPDSKAHAYLAQAFNPRFAYAARNAAGQLIGIAGFKTEDGALVERDEERIAQVYGRRSAPLRALALAMLDRPVEANTLLMDGVCVATDARGCGVGSALLDAITREAARRGLAEVRLDVVDGNDGARRLYERHGFRATKHIALGPLRWVFGFRGAATMTRAVAAD